MVAFDQYCPLRSRDNPRVSVCLATHPESVISAFRRCLNFPVLWLSNLQASRRLHGLHDLMVGWVADVWLTCRWYAVWMRWHD